MKYSYLIQWNEFDEDYPGAGVDDIKHCSLSFGISVFTASIMLNTMSVSSGPFMFITILPHI